MADKTGYYLARVLEQEVTCLSLDARAGMNQNKVAK